MSSSDPNPALSERVGRLVRRWDPTGVLISDEKAQAAIKRLKHPEVLTRTELARAQRVCDLAVHPVLEQTIPSAFRVCSLLPVTSVLSLAMISSKSPVAAVIFHWFYQSHSAATRYCNYADTSRDLDPRRMQVAYAASTVAACTIAIGATAVVSRFPRLRLAGLVVPHSAVASAGAISTILNAEVELREGVLVTDAAGHEIGVSRAAAKETVKQAVLLHSVIVPSCALLLPVVTMRTFVVPRLLAQGAHRLWSAAAGLVLGSACFVTPLAAALVPPVVRVPASQLEPDLQSVIARRRSDTGAPDEVMYSAKLLY